MRVRQALLAMALLLCACGGPPRLSLAARDGEGWLLSLTAVREGLLAVGGVPGTAGSPGSGTVTLLDALGPVVQRRSPSPAPGMLWWAHSPDSQSAWLVGEGGAVVRYQGGAMTVVPAQTSATLYGVYAVSDEDVWAVGGDDGQPGVILRGGRGGLKKDSGAPTTGVLFKVWGSRDGSLTVVGAGGVVLRREPGGAWRSQPALIPGNERLFGVHGGAAGLIAVGGVGQGRVVDIDGNRLLETPSLRALTGVWVSADGAVLVSGQGGQLAFRPSGGAFAALPAVTEQDLHAVFGLPSRRRFAVGGNLSQLGVRPPTGVLLAEDP